MTPLLVLAAAVVVYGLIAGQVWLQRGLLWLALRRRDHEYRVAVRKADEQRIKRRL
jgi:hypothetical protein